MGFANSRDRRLLVSSGDGTCHYDEQAAKWVFKGPWNEQEEKYDGVIYVAAAEYRYDGGRERYLVRLRDPNGALVRESFLAPTTAGILSLTGLHSCPLVWKRNPAIVRAR